jgi:hypothetical protein
MPVYELGLAESIDTGVTAHWRFRVHAPDADHARTWADEEFQVDVESVDDVRGVQISPGLNTDRATCRLADPQPEEYREGQIELWRGDGAGTVTSAPIGAGPVAGGRGGNWVVVKEGDRRHKLSL